MILFELLLSHGNLLPFLKTILPLLKLVRGDMFSDKHWIEMLGILGIPNKPVEGLVFGDFLSAKESILSQSQALQVGNTLVTISFAYWARRCLEILNEFLCLNFYILL